MSTYDKPCMNIPVRVVGVCVCVCVCAAELVSPPGACMHVCVDRDTPVRCRA